MSRNIEAKHDIKFPLLLMVKCHITKCIRIQNKASDISNSLHVISSTVNYLFVTKKKSYYNARVQNG
jgi:hypothetical protein